MTDNVNKLTMVNVRGGGFTIGRSNPPWYIETLLQADADYRPALKKAGLTRDPRMKERRSMV